MSFLVAADGERADIYARIEDTCDLSLATGPAIVPLTVIDAAIADREAHRRNERLGLAVPGDTPVSAIAPYLGALDLIAIVFPSFSDGRGFSLARRLRRAGFTGTLRASGPIVADQFAEALACGFDEVLVPDAMAARQPLEQWLAARDIVTGHYQNGYSNGASIMQRRLSARKAAE